MQAQEEWHLGSWIPHTLHPQMHAASLTVGLPEEKQALAAAHVAEQQAFCRKPLSQCQAHRLSHSAAADAAAAAAAAADDAAAAAAAAAAGPCQIMSMCCKHLNVHPLRRLSLVVTVFYQNATHVHSRCPVPCFSCIDSVAFLVSSSGWVIQQFTHPWLRLGCSQ